MWKKWFQGDDVDDDDDFSGGEFLFKGSLFEVEGFSSKNKNIDLNLEFDRSFNHVQTHADPTIQQTYRIHRATKTYFKTITENSQTNF